MSREINGKTLVPCLANQPRKAWKRLGLSDEFLGRFLIDWDGIPVAWSRLCHNLALMKQLGGNQLMLVFGKNKWNFRVSNPRLKT
jgi:hypothetical protein